MTAVIRAARAAVSRRRLQTFIVTMVVLLSAATAVLALGLLVVSHAPFDSAFGTAHGAHAAVTIAAGEPAAAVSTTATAPGVTAAAGPFAQASAGMSGPAGLVLSAGTITGRAQMAGPVDRLSLDSGTWLTGPGQIVLSRDYAGPLTRFVGSDVTVDVVGKPALRIVGIADSVTATSDAWVWPSQDNVLHATGTPTDRQMLYRFTAHGSAAAIRASVARATASLTPGSVTGTVSYLTLRQAENRSISAFVPFVVAFAVLGMILSVLITTNVVGGAVVSGFRTIGVLKTLGFTPGQVVAVYVLQVLAPAIVGCVSGVGLGVALATPLLAQTDRAYDLPASVGGVPIWIMIVVFACVPILVTAAAVGPATRAGRLAANEAISVGRAPRAGRGFRLRRALTATRLPRALAIGLGMPVARPARAAGTVVAIMLGAVTLVFAVGLTSSLAGIHSAFTRVDAVPVSLPTLTGAVMVAKPGSAPPPAITPPDPATLRAEIAAQPGTAHVVAETDVTVHLPGFHPDVTVEAYDGDARWTGFAMIAGHWYTGAGQVVASSYLLRQTGHEVGDRITIVGDSGQRTVTITGSFLDGGDNFDLVADASTLTGVADITGTAGVADHRRSDIEIGLNPGTDPSAYARSLQAKFPLSSGVFVDDRTQDNNERTFDILDALITTLTLLLCAVAALGVLNTVVLTTRERVHDIGVLKSIGMTPGQIRTMIITSMIGLGLVAGIIAVPAGIALHHGILPAMADAAGTALPTSIIHVYGFGELIALGATGIVLAIMGALIPAGWAARTRVAIALRAE